MSLSRRPAPRGKDPPGGRSSNQPAILDASSTEICRSRRSASMKRRNAASVGMRPADECGWVRYPRSSKSAKTLRIVAGDRSRPYFLERVRLPTGMPVAVNSVTTALRMARSLFERPVTTGDSGPLSGAPSTRRLATGTERRQKVSVDRGAISLLLAALLPVGVRLLGTPPAAAADAPSKKNRTAHGSHAEHGQDAGYRRPNQPFRRRDSPSSRRTPTQSPALPACAAVQRGVRDRSSTRREIRVSRPNRSRGVLEPVRLLGPGFRRDLSNRLSGLKQRPPCRSRSSTAGWSSSLSDFAAGPSQHGIDEVRMFSAWRPPLTSWPEGKLRRGAPRSAGRRPPALQEVVRRGARRGKGLPRPYRRGPVRAGRRSPVPGNSCRASSSARYCAPPPRRDSFTSSCPRISTSGIETIFTSR